MNYVEHAFNGKLNRLSLTAGALFQIYEKYGYTEDLSGTLKLGEDSTEGWDNTCWLYALLASQGELQRRSIGYDHEPMIAMEAVRLFASPADVPGIKNAIYAAIHLGFTKTSQPNEDREVDLVLKELELEEKKKEAGAGKELLSLLSQIAFSGSADKKPCSSAPGSSPI